MSDGSRPGDFIKMPGYTPLSEWSEVINPNINTLLIWADTPWDGAPLFLVFRRHNFLRKETGFFSISQVKGKEVPAGHNPGGASLGSMKAKTLSPNASWTGPLLGVGLSCGLYLQDFYRSIGRRRITVVSKRAFSRQRAKFAPQQSAKKSRHKNREQVLSPLSDEATQDSER